MLQILSGEMKTLNNYQKDTLRYEPGVGVPGSQTWILITKNDPDLNMEHILVCKEMRENGERKCFLFLLSHKGQRLRGKD